MNEERRGVRRRSSKRHQQGKSARKTRPNEEDDQNTKEKAQQELRARAMGPPGRTSPLSLRQTLRASLSPRILPPKSYRLPQPVQSDIQLALSVRRCVPAPAKLPSTRALQSVYNSRKKGEVVRRGEASAMDVSGVGSAPMSHNAGVSPSASSAIQFLTLCQRLKVQNIASFCMVGLSHPDILAHKIIGLLNYYYSFVGNRINLQKVSCARLGGAIRAASLHEK